MAKYKTKDKIGYSLGDYATNISKDDDEFEFVRNLEEIIIKNLGNNTFSVKSLAREVGMSRTSLYTKLKGLLDLSAKDFIIHVKLKFAQNLLVQGKMSIKEVAYSSGFSSPKYFSTSFKKFYGMTPSEFLNREQNDDGA